MKNYTIRTEQPRDFKIVENLTREAFWNVYRPGCTEHYVLHCYRNEPDFVPELSLVLEVDGEIIGHVMYAWSHIDADDGRKIRMMTFGPISIRPDYKRKGYGKTLLDHSMRIAAEMGAGCLLICGNIAFYGKSGFVVASTRGIRYTDDPESDAPYFLCRKGSSTESPAATAISNRTLSPCATPRHSRSTIRNFRTRKSLRCLDS